MTGVTERKIRSFLNLPNGWHYGSGHPPTREAIAKAISCVDFLGSLGFEKTDAFPGIDGAIMVTGYMGDHCVEVTIETNGTFRFAHEIGDDEEAYEENLSSISVADRLASASTRNTYQTRG